MAPHFLRIAWKGRASRRLTFFVFYLFPHMNCSIDLTVREKREPEAVLEPR